MLKQIITESARVLRSIFSAEENNRVAREKQVVTRRSKLDGNGLFTTLVQGYLEHPRASLTELCQTSADLGIRISKQGLDGRITEHTVEFLQDRLAQVGQQIQHRWRLAPACLAQFGEVYLQDSTILSLPTPLASQFAGSGGNASSAAVKVQVSYGLLSGQIHLLQLQSANQPDVQYRDHLSLLQPGSLLIQDLGFFSLPTLHQIHHQQAFFLSRWRSDLRVAARSDPPTPLDLLAFLSQLDQPVSEYAVWVGQALPVACRMIVVRLPSAVVEQRRRRLRADHLRRGDPLPERALALCAWNIFLTNLPPERLTLHQLLVCYALRWQIELVFKLWKSQAGFAQVSGKRTARVLCDLYARLIGLLLIHFLIAPLRCLAFQQASEISPLKALKILQHAFPSLFAALARDPAALLQQLEDLSQRILWAAKKEARGKRLTSFQTLLAADSLDLDQLYSLA
jgi:hypothetical protein